MRYKAFKKYNSVYFTVVIYMSMIFLSANGCVETSLTFLITMSNNAVGGIPTAIRTGNNYSLKAGAMEETRWVTIEVSDDVGKEPNTFCRAWENTRLTRV